MQIDTWDQFCLRNSHKLQILKKLLILRQILGILRKCLIIQELQNPPQVMIQMKAILSSDKKTMKVLYRKMCEGKAQGSTLDYKSIGGFYFWFFLS